MKSWTARTHSPISTLRGKSMRGGGIRRKILFSTVVGEYINTMKTTFFEFDLYLAVKQPWIHINISVNRNCQFKKVTCKLVIRKKLVNNKSLNKKVVFVVLMDLKDAK